MPCSIQCAIARKLARKKFEIDTEVLSWNRGICKGRGVARVDGDVACEADMLITIPQILERYLPSKKGSA